MENEMAGRQVEGLYITNGTYPYLSMRDGDGFAKKFGGASGDGARLFPVDHQRLFGRAPLLQLTASTFIWPIIALRITVKITLWTNGPLLMYPL
jgi:hypothetical protein